MKIFLQNHFLSLNRILENKILLNTFYLILLVTIFTTSIIFHGISKKKIFPFLINSIILETIIWIFPTLIIIILSIFTYKSSLFCNSNKEIYSNLKPLIIEIISLNWKWIIIFPSQKILLFNEFCIPVNIPIKFFLISNSIMNSICIPKIGIQLYCMSNYIKTITFLNLKHGYMHGASSNFNGIGYSNMKLNIFSITKHNFYYWIMKIKFFKNKFILKYYNFLSKNSFLNFTKIFNINKNKLFFSILKLKL